MWLAKAGAVTLGAGVVALVAIGGFWLIIGLVANGRGVDVSSAEVTHVAWHVVRATALAMGAGLGAFALTMIFRHTVATLALLFVYSIGGEIVVNLLPFEGAARWSLGNNAVGWLADELPLLRRQHRVHPGRAVQLDADDDPPRVRHLPGRPARGRRRGLAALVQPPRRLSAQRACSR